MPMTSLDRAINTAGADISSDRRHVGGRFIGEVSYAWLESFSKKLVAETISDMEKVPEELIDKLFAQYKSAVSEVNSLATERDVFGGILKIYGLHCAQKTLGALQP